MQDSCILKEGDMVAEIKRDGAVFHVDFEKTKTYYQTHSLCECCCCRNLYAQIKQAAPKLDQFLSTFGVDITKPDEAASVEMTDYIDYLFVGYTVTGKMEFEDLYEKQIDKYKITISHGDNPYEWFPHEQKEPCFFISVSGISLPWVLDEPFPKPETFKEKIKKVFKKHKA